MAASGTPLGLPRSKYWTKTSKLTAPPAAELVIRSTGTGLFIATAAHAN
jgi:hypothetical protein